MNVYDSQKIVDMFFASHGMQVTSNPKDADLILLNTCSIREKAEEKVFSDLGRFYVIKKRSQKKIVIGVGGCVAVQEGEKILKRAPYVDLIFGPQNTHHLPVLYNEVLEKPRSLVDIAFLKNEKFSHFPKPTFHGPSAFVTIMEGCNQCCSYCIVPYTRGKEISRPIGDIICECEELANQGVKELHFLGQNVNTYKHEDKYGAVDLASLLESAAKIGGITRLKFTTSHPSFFNERLLNVFANEPKLVNHIHLPVQSGCNGILRGMKRSYTVERYKEIIYKLRALRPDISVSSDFIVGFPNETESDFEDTLNLAREIKFDNSFSFIYSPRPNTKASLMEDLVPLNEKKIRLKILQELLNKTSLEISDSMFGTLQQVLVLEKASKNSAKLFGRAYNDKAVTFFGDEELIGQTVDVRIIESSPNCLHGELV